MTFSAITERRAERTGRALLSWLRMMALHPQQLPLDFLADGACLSIPFELYTDGLGVFAMATLSQLVDTVAKCEGMDPATVSLIARGVREARLITTGGRGLSAAKMTVADAANLLIAVNATVSAREAPQTVRNYRRLETVAWFRRDDKVVHAERTQLGDAIEHLIEAASIRTLKNYLSTTVPLLIAQEYHKERAKIELIFHKPMPYAHLTISVLEGNISFIGGLRPEDDDFDKNFGIVTQIEFKFNLPSDPVQRRAKRHYGDRKDTTSIGYSTIRAISKLFGEKAE